VVAAPGALAGVVWLDLPGATASRILVEITPAETPAVKPGSAGKENSSAAGQVEGGAKDLFDPQGLFKQHVFGHEPFYFIAGTKSPNAKIQLSFKYRLLSAEDSPNSWANDQPWLEGFHFAYTQTSLWDWRKESAPFFDTSYKPELLYETNQNGTFFIFLHPSSAHVIIDDYQFYYRQKSPPIGSKKACSIQRAASKFPRFQLPCKKWRDLILQVWHTDPLICPKCRHSMRVIAVIDQRLVIEKILRHLSQWNGPPPLAPARSPPHARVWTREPCDDVNPMPDYENVLTD
jgi:hypothetical protein